MSMPETRRGSTGLRTKSHSRPSRSGEMDPVARARHRLPRGRGGSLQRDVTRHDLQRERNDLLGCLPAERRGLSAPPRRLASSALTKLVLSDDGGRPAVSLIED